MLAGLHVVAAALWTLALVATATGSDGGRRVAALAVLAVLAVAGAGVIQGPGSKVTAYPTFDLGPWTAIRGR